MRKLTKTLNGFFKDERGATAIEYGMILALMALAIIAAMTSVGEATTGAFERAGENWN